MKNLLGEEIKVYDYFGREIRIGSLVAVGGLSKKRGLEVGVVVKMEKAITLRMLSCYGYGIRGKVITPNDIKLSIQKNFFTPESMLVLTSNIVHLLNFVVNSKGDEF